MKMKDSLISLLSIFLLFSSNYSMAQSDLPPPEIMAMNTPPPPPGLVVPIDSNISLLIAAGLGLGIFFLVSSRKKELTD